MPSERLTFRFPKKLLTRIEAIAKREKRTRSDVARRLIEKGLERKNDATVTTKEASDGLFG
jgi:metal-responsive CopG/Arc/MetJ family transcriptional regulator